MKLLQRILGIFKKPVSVGEAAPIINPENREAFLDAIRRKFGELSQKNPKNFSLDYLSQIKVILLDIGDRAGFINLSFKIFGLGYNSKWSENGVSFNSRGFDEDTRLFAEHLYGELEGSYDPLRADPEVRRKIDEAGEKAREQVLHGREPRFGDCHKIWPLQKKILKDEHGIDWKDPEERMPGARYD
jgi:hypothetical protein